MMFLGENDRPGARWYGIAAVGLAAMMAGGAAALAAAPTSPDGIWYTKNDESIIKVHPCTADATAFCGTVVWLKDPRETDGTPKIDRFNKDPAKRAQPILGLDVLLDMKADGDRWKGQAYNADDGKFYDITFHVRTDREPNDTADVRGCILGFLCQTETFRRAAEVPGGDPTVEADASPAKKHKPKHEKAMVQHR